MRNIRILLIAALCSGVLASPAGSVVSRDGSTIIVAGSGTTGSSSAEIFAVKFGGFVFGTATVETQPGFVFVSEVKCIRVVGTRVLVGGVIVRAPTPVIGRTSLVVVEDGGFGRGGDRANFAFSFSGLDSCPEFTFPFPLFPLTSGDFVVVSSLH